MGLRKFIFELLRVCQVPMGMDGFGYLVDAIEIAALDREHLHTINKTLYPEVGKRHGVKAGAIERSIRAAISKTKTKHTSGAFIKAAVWCVDWFYRQENVCP